MLRIEICIAIFMVETVCRYLFADSGCLQLYATQGTMAFWTLIKGLLLFANAFAILNEDRFLAPRGWTLEKLHQTGRRNSPKGQIIGIIYACQYMRLPLLLINLVVIALKIIAG